MEENAKFYVVHITVRFTFLWNGWHVNNIYAKQKRAENAFTDAKWLKIDANQINRDVGDASAFYCDVKGCGKKKNFVAKLLTLKCRKIKSKL